MKNLLFTLSLLLCWAAALSQPKPEWSIKPCEYPAPDGSRDQLSDFIMLSDGRTAGVGASYRRAENSAGSQGLLLIFKADLNQQLPTRITCEADGETSLHSVAEAPDGSLYAVGKTCPDGRCRPLLLHFDRTGKQIGSPLPTEGIMAEGFEQIRWLSNGAALISTVNTAHGLDTWLLRDGVLVKNQTLPGSSFKNLTAALPTPDGGMWLCGNTYQPKHNLWCRYFDAQGHHHIISQPSILGDKNMREELMGAAVTPDGSLLLVGQMWPSGALPIYWEIDLKGTPHRDPTWPNDWSGSDIYTSSVYCTSDNRRFTVLQSKQDKEPRWVEMSTNNTVLRSKSQSLPNAEGFLAFRILETQDGNLLIAGHTGNGEGSLIKIYTLQRTAAPKKVKPSPSTSIRYTEAKPSLSIRQPSRSQTKADGRIHTHSADQDQYLEIELAIAENVKSWASYISIEVNGQPYEKRKDDKMKSAEGPSSDGLYHSTLTVERKMPISKDSLRCDLHLKVCYDDILCDALTLRYERRKPRLYVLAIGANGGQGNSEVKYAFHDAQAMTRIMQEQACDSCLFERVVADTFLLQNPARMNFAEIRERLIALKDTLNQRDGTRTDHEQDCIVLAFSGHGEMEGGAAYLLPSDARGDAKRSKRMHFQQDFMGYLDDVPGKKLVFVDACRKIVDGEKGNSLAEAMAKYSNAAPDVFTFYSCSVGESSWEANELKQGVFTYALMEMFTPRSQSMYLDYQPSGGFVTPEAISKLLSQRIPVLVREYKPGQTQTPVLSKGKISTTTDLPLFWLSSAKN